MCTEDLNMSKSLMFGLESQLKAGDILNFLYFRLTHVSCVVSNTITRTSVKGALHIVLSCIIAWVDPLKICKNYLNTPSSHKGGFSLDRVKK